MEKTTLIVFSYQAYAELRTQYFSFERLYSHLLEDAFLKLYKRSASFVCLSPKERYEELLRHHPTVLQKATQYHIASYLGISYQHLSRLRNQK